MLVGNCVISKNTSETLHATKIVQQQNWKGEFTGT